MKLSKQEAIKLNQVLSTCALGAIDSITIDDGVVRGISEGKTCAIISDHEAPAFGQKIGISRIGLLRQRLDLFLTETDLSIDAKDNDRGEVSSLEISAGKSKVQYRCTSTALIKAPKSINDKTNSIITLDKSELQMVLNAIRVMGAKRITLIIKTGKDVSFEATDSTNDKFTVTLKTQAELIDEEDAETCVHHYPTEVLGPLLKAAVTEQGVSCSIGQAGSLVLLVNNHTMYIFSQIDGE